MGSERREALTTQSLPIVILLLTEAFTPIGKDCVIGAGALVVKDLLEDSVVQGLAGEVRGNARRLNRVKDTS